MTVISTRFDTGSEQFLLDRRAMLDALEPLESLADRVLGAGGVKTVERHRSRGKLLARERVDLLLDEDAPFLELSCYAGAHEPGRAARRPADHGHRPGLAASSACSSPTSRR